MPTPERRLRLTFHGRVLDHLSIQMYQSPVAALAELIANSWDADAETVRIDLPSGSDEAQIVIGDDGHGMTFEECQAKYLNVGWSRRGDQQVELTKKGRPVLGRKGIGKFAGFGIATIIRVETVAASSGEKTVFEMDYDQLRTEAYVEEQGGDVRVVEYLEPNRSRKPEHGTTVTLKSLRIARAISPPQFAKSMARRFLLHQQVADFQVFINDAPLPASEDLTKIQFVFPRDYKEGQKPEGLTIRDGWGEETLPNGHSIKWRISFYQDPIDEEELRGIAVFSHGKVAQTPFFFHLSGGLGGQIGQQYISGQVQADYVDELTEDVMATERQRINWGHGELAPLLEWGQDKTQELLRIWQDRRAEERQRQLEEKLAGFASRLGKLPKHEQETVRKAILKVANVSSLTTPQFEDLGAGILTAWEAGRLRELIADISGSQDMNAEQFLSLLIEGDVLAALNVGEAVRTKIDAIRGLRTRVERRELEKAVRDYIAEKPWLLDPRWETFAVEKSVKSLLADAAKSAGLAEAKFAGRIDLALRSDELLLVVEFVRPGQKVDWDHLNRCVRYVQTIRSKVETQTGLRIGQVRGLIVADKLDDDATVKKQILDLRTMGIEAFEWHTLLDAAESRWKDFLDILVERAPEDERMKSLKGNEP